jgi:tRNA-specific 2-thiouridylase
MLQKARDRLKDQSYFLYRLRQAQLRHILFPLGGYSKEEVRFLAKRFGLPVAEKLASQEICFIAQDSYRGFLKERLKEGLWPGPILDQQGRCIGRHQGIAFYTIGQRQGLGLAMGYPLYVTAIDCRRNCLIVGRREDALAQRFSVSRLHFVGRRPEKKVVLRVKIRYNHPEVAAEIIPRGHNLEVSLLRPQFAVTCGQAAVFYDNATVVGGGTIDEIYG